MSKKRRRHANAYRSPDAHTRAAKSTGFAARSVFKLDEIDRRLGLLKQGRHVLDLGAAPGSWSQLVCTKIGSNGRLLAVDRNPLEIVLPAPHEAVQGDAFDLDAATLHRFAPYDIVLSDMAPNTSGDKRTDQIRSAALFERALEVAANVLKPGGSFVGKLFMSGDFPRLREAVRAHFATVRTLRPASVRSQSYEVFLVGLERRAPEQEERAPA